MSKYLPKIRAFYDGKMYAVQGIDNTLNRACLIEAGGLTDDAFIDLEKLEIFRSTDFRDREKKEMYEGDIIVLDDRVKPAMPFPKGMGIAYIAEIRWIEERGKFRAFRQKDETIHDGDELNIWSAPLCKVIGNIKENPDLFFADVNDFLEPIK